MSTPTKTRLSRGLFVLTFVLSCQPEVVVSPPDISSVEIAGSTAQLYVGEQLLLTAQVKDSRGQIISSQPIHWGTSDQRVLSVDSVAGRVTAVGAGDATVTATAAQVTVAVPIKVLERVAVVQISPGLAIVGSGETIQLSAVLLDRNGEALSSRSIAWASSDSAVVSVTAAGLVVTRRHLDPGAKSAVISATAEGRSGMATLRVSAISVQSLRIEQPSPEGISGDTSALTAVALDSLGNVLTGRTVRWSTPDTAILAVSAEGKVVPNVYLGPESRVGSVVAISEGIQASVPFAVRPLPVATVQVAFDSAVVVAGDSLDVSVLVRDKAGRPLNGRSVRFETPSASWAEVDASGRLRSSPLLGAAYRRVVVRAFAGAAVDSAVVVVRSRVASIALSAGSKVLSIGDSTAVVVTSLDVDGNALAGLPVDFRSTNDSVAVVSPSGVLRAIGAGRTTITAAVDGAVSVVDVFVSRARIPGRTVSVGGGHACALNTEGKVYCWGYNVSTGAGPYVRAPREVVTDIRFASIDAGNGFTCGVSVDGEVACWGANWAGQLGNGGYSSLGLPTKVGWDVRFVQVAAASGFACALTVASAVVCWGDNGEGGLGRGFSGGLGFLPGEVILPEPARAVVVGKSTQFACALGVSGAVWCWGDGRTGALGNGVVASRSAPVMVSGLMSAVSISAGGDHACALLSDGSAVCWGMNGGSSYSVSVPGGMIAVVPVRAFEAGQRWISIEAAREVSCGILASGEGRCGGLNGYGQIGTGVVSPRVDPTSAIVGGVQFAQMSHNGQTGCGIDRDGAVWCWGFGTYGLLGDGNPPPTYDNRISSSPVRVLGGPYKVPD